MRNLPKWSRSNGDDIRSQKKVDRFVQTLEKYLETTLKGLHDSCA